MSAGFIFNWTRTDVAGRIHVTQDPNHEDEDAAFAITACSSGLQAFLSSHDSPPGPSIQVSCDLFTQGGHLFARNID